jgi:cysteine sulfinate desulfinase/cysteine desulfurase-like protein
LASGLLSSPASPEDKNPYQERVITMSIEKKSLISTLKTTKKANVATAPTLDEGITKTEVLKKNALRKNALRKNALRKNALRKNTLHKN